jgi:hypothetical protein
VAISLVLSGTWTQAEHNGKNHRFGLPIFFLNYFFDLYLKEMEKKML